MTFKEKINKIKQGSINDLIYYNYYHKKIDEQLVYVESRDGNDFTGNIFRIVEELSTGKYGDFKIVVYAKEKVHPKISELQKNYNLKIDEIISKEFIATKTLEIAKYIITDSGMRPKYVKRPGQIVLETWHGTPLKTMGIDNEAEEHRCANIQQVFFACDYLLYPNDYMKERMLNSYMMEKIYPGTILLGGYPRNEVFFKRELGVNLKEKLGFGDKQVFAYMPTFKGLFLNRKDKEQKDEVYEYLKEIDTKLTDNQVLLVKLHVYNRERIDFSNFKHIQDFPLGYEIYDVLNMTDCLITDYSSVFFDYANSRNKIIIFNYDEEEYMKDRGTYFPISDLPFPKVQNVDDLVNELNTPKNYDDEEFLEKFCTYDNPNAIENLCRHVFKGEKSCREEKIDNSKKNILIYAGGLRNNGMTSSLLNVLANVDTDEHNYFICYAAWDEYIQHNHVEVFKKVPKGIEYCPLRMSLNRTILENREFLKFLEKPNQKVSKKLTRMFERELHRAFSGFKFDSIIHFNGYGIEETMMFSVSDATKSIWVHNDMVEEIRRKDNQNLPVLKYVYSNYDNVVVVSPDLVNPTSQISGRKDNIKLVHNINDYKTIIENSKREVEITPNTTVYNNDINEVLSKEGYKFITIGRYSPEKGHDRLIKAFNEFCKDYPDTQLIIIGGYGVAYEDTCRLVDSIEYGSNITLINNIANPMPILSKCDLFVLASDYEGWPMVVMEADTFDIPLIATDITGTQWMKDYNAYIIENNQEAILKAMYEFEKGNVKPLGINYKEYNRDAVEEFLKII